MDTNKAPITLVDQDVALLIFFLKCIMVPFLPIAFAVHCIFLGVETMSEELLNAIIIALLCHILLLWVVCQGRISRRDYLLLTPPKIIKAYGTEMYAVMICAILLTMDVLAMIAFWHPSSLFIAAFVLDLLLALNTYNLVYIYHVLIRRICTMNGLDP